MSYTTGEEREMLTNDLRETIARDPGAVAVIVGAGLTIGALPDPQSRRLAAWSGLLHEGVNRAADLGTLVAAEAERLREMLTSEDPEIWIAAGEAVTRHLGGPRGGEFARWLRETAGTFAGKSSSTPALEAVAALARQGALVATVNYDGVLEKATGLPGVTWREPARVERALRGDSPAILHLHGYWEAPESVVLGSRSYEDVLADAHAQAVMRTLRMSRTLVFVGHGAGLEDPNWGPFLRWTEAVFKESPYRHFRLVRAGEVAAVQAEHRAAQRIFAVPYGERHDDLGPFLRSLVPPGEWVGVASGAAEAKVVAQAEPPRRTVVLRLNIGSQEWDWLSEASILSQVREVFGDEAPVMLPEVRRVVDRESISAREWRAIARDLMALREAAKVAVPEGEKVRYVVAGQAPLPAFAYLGQLMARMRGPVTCLNRRQQSDVWDVVGPMERVAPGRDLFTVKVPERGREQLGKVVLSVRCSNIHPFAETMIEPVVKAEGGAVLCSYEIVNAEGSHLEVPMTAAEMAVLQGHVRRAMAWMEERCKSMDGLVVCVGGPTWVSFWLGYMLNPYVFGRVDFPNLVTKGGRRYVRALSSPMHKAPWLEGKAKVLFIGAEPDNGTRTRGAKAATTIQWALERELRWHGEVYEFRTVGKVTIQEFMREVDSFRPDVLHMHLHGTEDGLGVVFEDERGDGKIVPVEAFAGLLRATTARPAVVVLSVCNSASLVPLLVSADRGIAEVVIAMNTVVEYAVAIDFAESFYEALARGRSLADAFDQGRSRVHASWGEKERDIIVCECAPGVVAEEVVLLPEVRRGGWAR